MLNSEVNTILNSASARITIYMCISSSSYSLFRTHKETVHSTIHNIAKDRQVQDKTHTIRVASGILSSNLMPSLDYMLQ